MAYAPMDRAKQLRRYADVIGKTATPMDAPVTPYSNPNWARLAQSLVGAGFQGAAERAASREDILNRERKTNLARAVMGLPTVTSKLPAATGPMSWLDKTLGFDAPSAAATPPLSVRNDDGSFNQEAIFQAAASANVDPLAAVGSAYQMKAAQRAMTSQELATSQATALRTMRKLQQRVGLDGKLSVENQRLWDATIPKLPADISALNTSQPLKDTKGNIIGYTDVNVLGQKVGSVKFRPAGQVVNVNTKGLTKEAETVGKARGEKLQAIESAADDATQNLEIIDQALDLYARSEGQDLTGPGAQTLLDIRSAIVGLVSAFGFNPKELGIDIEKITDQQTLRSALNQMVLKRTQIIKGALSDRELLFSAEATANFGNTPAANAMILLFQKRAGIRAEQLAELANEYYDEFGTLGGTKGKLFKGKAYKSFRQFQNEFKNKDDVIGVGMISEIDSLSQLSAYIKLRGGLNKLSDAEAKALLARNAILKGS